MNFLGMKSGFEPKHIVNGYNWATIDSELLVDIDGSDSSLSITIAKHFSKICCVV